MREPEARAGVEPAPLELGDGRVEVRHPEDEHGSLPPLPSLSRTCATRVPNASIAKTISASSTSM